MAVHEQDPDVVRWGLHLLDVCSLTNGCSPGMITCYDQVLSQVEYVKEGYSETKPINVENDEILAYAFQEELSRVAAAESAGSPDIEKENQKASILAQDWLSPSNKCSTSEELSRVAAAETTGAPDIEKENKKASILAQDWLSLSNKCSSSGQEIPNDDEGERENSNFCLSPEDLSVGGKDQVGSPEVANEFTLDGEVGKRLNNMVPVPHVPKTNGEIPSVDEATSDHQRLLERLQLYDLVELKVLGDGNCQFRSLSDQIYRTPEHHKFVRQQVVDQLKSYPELYEGYVPMAYDDYLKKISKTGEWGDHVTLQAAADTFGVKVFILTSFKDTCYIEILPHVQKSERIIFLSFWAEVHYNSIYPLGELPEPETKKKKWWWQRLGSQ